MSQNNNESYDIQSAINKIRKDSEKKSRKFDEALDFGCKLGIDPSKTDQSNVRGAVEMPHGTGKKVVLAVFCADQSKVEALKAAGADYAGGQELVDQFRAGEVSCDLCLASPDSMIMLAKISKILGPKGLMPNPKSGTVSDDLVTLVQSFKKGKVVYRSESNGNLYAGIGRLSFSNEQLVENFQALLEDVFAKKPESVNKAVYIKNAFLSSTMGEGSCVLDKKALILDRESK